MRDYGTCLHEAGHLVACRVLAGRVTEELVWEPDGGATVKAFLKYEPPGVRAVVAVMGHAAQALLAPHQVAGMSGADMEMFTGAIEDAAGTVGVKQRAYAQNAWRYARAFTRKYHDEILALADILHDTGEVPEAYLHPAIAEMQRLEAEIAETKRQIEAEKRQEEPLSEFEQQVERWLDDVDRMVKEHEQRLGGGVPSLYQVSGN